MGYPFWAEPSHIVHYREYPPGTQQEAITTVCAVFEEFHQRSPPVPTSFKRNAQSDSTRKVVSISPNIGAMGRSDGHTREWSAAHESQGRTFSTSASNLLVVLPGLPNRVGGEPTPQQSPNPTV